MRLYDYLNARGLHYRAFGEQVGESTSQIHRYARGIRIPKPTAMVEIVRATRGMVMPNDFYELDEVLAEIHQPGGEFQQRCAPFV